VMEICAMRKRVPSAMERMEESSAARRMPSMDSAEVVEAEVANTTAVAGEFPASFRLLKSGS